MPSTKPRKRPRSGFKLVPYPGTPEGVVDVLSEALVRAQDDQTLAVVLVEVRRAGEIANVRYGEDDGFGHLMVAGLHYALHDMMSEDEE